jgi:hypothetical protein
MVTTIKPRVPFASLDEIYKTGPGVRARAHQAGSLCYVGQQQQRQQIVWSYVGACVSSVRSSHHLSSATVVAETIDEQSFLITSRGLPPADCRLPTAAISATPNTRRRSLVISPGECSNFGELISIQRDHRAGKNRRRS